MPEEFGKTIQETASSKDDDKEKITETGYFYLSQQVNFNTQQLSRLDAKIDRLDNKIDNIAKDLNSKIEGLNDKIEGLAKWAIGTIIAVILASVSWWIAAFTIFN